MKNILRTGLILGLAGVLVQQSQAVVIDFTGGTAYINGGGTFTPNNAALTSNVDYYEEGGFRLDFISTTPASSFIGDYYGNSNDVIHGHWAAGGIGDLTSIVVTKIGGGTFDLNYFILTSNTDLGGGPATGFEQAFIRARDGSNNIIAGSTQQLPSEDWGFPATQIFLGAAYDSIASFEFFVTSGVDCFGMDEFYIDEPAPPGVPDGGSTAILIGLGLVGIVALRRKLA